jgi:23S rRNA pseudouridine955/2504/2580 synthase/23S rRNA pseudouridine1911/1915/1917 synthase
VHAAHAGAPLLGDVTYGGRRTLTLPNGAVVALERVFLHAHEVHLPTARYVANLPETFVSTWARVGGDPGSWHAALDLPWPMWNTPSGA